MIVREFVNVGQCREVVPAYWLRFREFFDFFRLFIYNKRKEERKEKRKEKMSKNNEYNRLIKLVEADGWQLIKDDGHKQFTHPFKKGKVTIPHRITKNIEISVLKQAGIYNKG